MSADESVTELAEAVEKFGALPVPVPVGPESLTAEREAEIREWVEAMGRKRDIRYYGSWQQHGELLGEIDRLRAQVAGLNESLSDAAERMRADRDRIAELEAQREALAERLSAGQQWRQGRNPELVSENFVSQSELRSIFGIPLVAPWADGLTKVFVPVASLREPEGEFYGFLHREGRVSHDLPEMGGPQ